MPADLDLLEEVLREVGSENLRDALREMVTEPDFVGVIGEQEVRQLASLGGLSLEAVLLVLTEVAKVYAQPQISGFHVGAIAQGSSTNAFYLGANMEYAGAALSFTLHAEQAATANAWQHGEAGLVVLACNEAPCGYCRQFLYEITTAPKLVLLLRGKKPQLLTKFLPEPFGPKDLEVEPGEELMSPQDHGLELEVASQDAAVLAALSAVNGSYAPLPYTKPSPCYAGVAVETDSGAVFTGRLAENAAFNPSLSPLEAAMSMWNFGSAAGDSPKRVVLVQAQGAIGDQASATEAVVASLQSSGPVAFEQHVAVPPEGG